MRRPEAADRSGRVGDAFSVVAFCTAGTAGGALLATGSLAGRGQAALAADIVRCLCRNWSATVRRIEFKWPLPGVAGAPGPALGAFLDKQIHDFTVTRALATESAATKLPPADIDFITIPNLAQLDGPDAKRALWQQLQEPSAGEREGPAPRKSEPSAGEREGPAPRKSEPSAGEREGPAPRKSEPSAGEREAPAPGRREP